jgi:hypothetical protein
VGGGVLVSHEAGRCNGVAVFTEHVHALAEGADATRHTDALRSAIPVSMKRPALVRLRRGSSTMRGRSHIRKQRSRP